MKHFPAVEALDRRGGRASRGSGNGTALRTHFSVGSLDHRVFVISFWCDELSRFSFACGRMVHAKPHAMLRFHSDVNALAGE